MREYIVFENDMNKLNFGKMSKVSMNFFLVLCSLMKNKGDDTVYISFSEIKQKANYTSGTKKKFVRDIDKMTDEILAINAKIVSQDDDDEIIDKFNLFQRFRIHPKKGILEIAISREFAWLLNEFKSYTIMELQEIINFKSKYTKNLFRLLKQWGSVGELKIIGLDNIKTFCSKIGIKDTYNIKRINQRCINPAIKEINGSNCAIKNLSVSFEYENKKGSPLKSFLFAWDKIEKVKICPELKENLTKKETKGYTKTKKKKGLPSFEYKRWNLDDLRKIIEKAGEDDDFDEEDYGSD